MVVLDFKSMYPSLIIAKNICFTTLSEEGTIEAPNGARFLSRDRREGLLPKILKDLMAQRDDSKKRMKEATDPEEVRYYDGLQNAVKILMNAVYGVFASSFYRFTDRNIGSAITAFARETVKTLIMRLEEEGTRSSTEIASLRKVRDRTRSTRIGRQVKKSRSCSIKTERELSSVEKRR